MQLGRLQAIAPERKSASLAQKLLWCMEVAARSFLSSSMTCSTTTPRL
jgi:hypothetical protein